MKKILFALLALFATMSMNAQVMKLMKDGKVVATYTADQADRAVFVNSRWVSLGNCTYTDLFVGTFFGTDNQTYQVEIEKDMVNEGMYRLVNPYGEKYPYNEPGDWDTSKTYYLEINAVNPDKVYIVPQMQGMDWGYGKFWMGSVAGLYIANGDPQRAEGNYGTLKDGVITFPEKTLLVAMSEYNNGGLYYGQPGAMIVMPGAPQKAAGKMKANSIEGKSMLQIKKEIKSDLKPFISAAE